MSALLGHVTSPSRMPFHSMAFLGFCATLDWRWIVTMLIMGLFVPIALGIGRLLAARSFMKRALNSYLASLRYECTEITLRAAGLDERFGFLKKGSSNADAVEQNRQMLRLFVVRGRDRMAR